MKFLDNWMTFDATCEGLYFHLAVIGSLIQKPSKEKGYSFVLCVSNLELVDSCDLKRR